MLDKIRVAMKVILFVIGLGFLLGDALDDFRNLKEE